MSGAFAVGELDGLPASPRRRIERVFSLTPPLEPLDIPEAVPTPDGPEVRPRPTNERGEWPYDHVPGEAWPIDHPERNQ